MAPPVFKTGLAGIAFAGGFDSLPPPPKNAPATWLTLVEHQLKSPEACLVKLTKASDRRRVRSQTAGSSAHRIRRHPHRSRQTPG